MRSSTLLAGLMMCGGIANIGFAQSVTYDFTGVVDGVNNESSVSIGETVTGTYTIDLANANPSQAGGNIPFGSATLLPGYISSVWQVQNNSGQSYGIPANSNFIFTSTAQVGSLSYATNTDISSNPYVVRSQLLGSVDDPGYNGYSGVFSTSEANQPVSGDSGFSGSDFYILSHSTTGVPYTIAGLPVFNPSDMTGVGQFDIGDGSVAYQITNLTPVTAMSAPEIDPGQLPTGMILLLGGLAVLRPRLRRVA